ncbi:hypothetical protein [Mucilaginibacter sp. OK098]|uniref:hypothetical protein n=1 Tax=Mucilaginibacter sp. OK098 TaxID=1855297 RepID=UPI0009219A07|nr:hypothetical protein [Mucilaginibacter sp. OK098]SHM19841.1 hypothetical protein SAMN05216524_1011128 [Mucilaginibacter sp. OK098]
MKKLPVLILLVAIVCKTTLLSAQNNNLTGLYNAATKLAMIAGSAQNIDTLMTITPANPVLKWKTIHGKNYVLMASFTSYLKGYPVGDSTTTTRAIWMFIPGQMQGRLRNKMTPKTDTIMKLNQMLGLPPVSGDTHIAQFWVQADDVFRPAGSPSITVPKASGTLDTNATPQYKLWFNANIISSYFMPLTGSQVYYPWTRMGYTYNWAPGAKRVGVSEFVLNANSGIWVEALYKASDYFKK